MNREKNKLNYGTAIIYARVSTDEQKETGFSLQEQKGRLEQFCKKEGIEKVHYFEEHHSAKNFDRPEFKQILVKLKSRQIKADVLIVTKIDRFSRDAMETFKMVNDLLRYDIKVYSLTEGLLDFTDSSKFFPLLIQAGAAQHENIVRSENVKRGMRQALKEGRWVWNAPLGYKNNKATKLIEIDKENGPLVKQGFEMLATGAFSADEVRRKLIESGLKNISKQTFLNMLRNIAYYGFIRVNATNEEPEQIVPAVHEPLISETLFMKVRGVLDGKKKIVQAM